MKNFKHTGRGPKYGSFNFSSKAGFSDSSGKVKNIGGYTRRTPKKKALGGLASSVPFKGTDQGFSEGGEVKSRLKKVLGSQYTDREAERLMKNRNMRKKVLGSQFTEREFRKAARKSPKSVGTVKGKFQ